jgi:hypothetical protein
MMSVANKLFMLRVIILIVVMLNVVAPVFLRDIFFQASLIFVSEVGGYSSGASYGADTSRIGSWPFPQLLDCQKHVSDKHTSLFDHSDEEKIL